MRNTIARISDRLEHWESILAGNAARWLPRKGTRPWWRSYHFWVIAALMALVAFGYYMQHTPAVNIAFFNRVATEPHDLLRTLFFILVIYASLVFRVRGSAIASLVFLCLVLPRAFFCSPYPDPLLRPLAFVIVGTFVSLVMAIELNRVDAEHSQLEQFLSDSMNRQEQEKRHLARELHDDSLQTLVDISHAIDALAQLKDNDSVKNGLRQLRGDVDNVVSGIRHFITGLRPPLLEEMGLESSLKWLAHETFGEQGIEVNVEIRGESRRLSDIIELNLFRIAQEALQNAKRHSQATRITVTLAYIRDKITLTIEDNGVGFSVLPPEKPDAQNKFGLMGMSERAHLVGGGLRVKSSPGKGTVIFVEVPLIGVQKG